MISIIICSRKADIPQELKDNIAATVGCEYELCVIDNSRNEYNIFTAYNEGVRRAKGEILCFMHEDIVFHSDKWGCFVENAFAKDATIGCAGIVGGQYISGSPIPWWESSVRVGGLRQGMNDAAGGYRARDVFESPITDQTEVAALDGVFICIRASLFDPIKWDDTTYNGFHLYDMDICMQVTTHNYKVVVLPNVLLEHLSDGNDDRTYYDALELFAKKWRETLPMYRGITMTPADIKWREGILGALYINRKNAERYLQISQSASYRVGKIILAPFKIFKKQ